VTSPSAPVGGTALAAVLAGEHAAIYGYGVIGAHVSGNDLSMVKSAQRDHEQSRDALTAKLIAARVSAPAASAAYQLPFAVSDSASARKLAVLLEERVAGLWRAAVAPTQGADRQLAVQALTAAAVRATRWRERATPNGPATVAFPGS
jgi:hypothetical protein